MCTVLLPQSVNPIAVIKYIISYIISHHISYHISYHISHHISYIYIIIYHTIYHIIYHIIYFISYIIPYIIYTISYNKFCVITPPPIPTPLTLFCYKAASDNSNVCLGTRQQGGNPVTVAVQYVCVNKTLFPPRRILCRLSRNTQDIL